jgi:hypothetical protein
MFGWRFLGCFGARACSGTRAVGGRRFGAGSRHATRRLWNITAETKLILVAVFILTVFVVILVIVTIVTIIIIFFIFFIFFVIFFIFFVSFVVIVILFEVKIFIADFVDGIFRVFFFFFFVIRKNDEVIEIFIVAAGGRRWVGSSGLSIRQGRCDVGRGGCDLAADGLIVVVVEEHFTTDVIGETAWF